MNVREFFNNSIEFHESIGAICPTSQAEEETINEISDLKDWSFERAKKVFNRIVFN